MRTFCCQVCRQPVYFENSRCTHCGATLGFLPDTLSLSALEQGPDGLWRVPNVQPKPQRGWLARVVLGGAPYEPERAAYRQCGNYWQHNVCNWMVPAEEQHAFCPACRHNLMIPNLSRPQNLDKWYRIERSKRRLFYSLMRLALPLRTQVEDPAGGLGFAFLSDQDTAPGETVMTGHADGVITINIDEADPSKREQMRMDMDERYRTLLGHFRHETGHYFWNLLIRDADRLEGFRALFGDERADYGTALQNHYFNGPPANWQDTHISAYATSHPWEDWGETWAHYLHIVDTLETAEHFGVQVERRLPNGRLERTNPNFDPYEIHDFSSIIESWLPLTFALNSLSRSMGQQDMYPFVLSTPAIDKLGYVHQVIRECSASSPDPAS